MPDPRDFLPPPPWEGLPFPRFMTKDKLLEQGPSVKYGTCENGIECIKNHMLRAHLFMSEALRFSSKGTITPEAQQKIIQAREQLLCEDDFQQAMASPIEVRTEVLKLFAATRNTWKNIETTGIDHGFGDIDDLVAVSRAIQGLYRKAYDIDKEYRLSKGMPVPAKEG